MMYEQGSQPLSCCEWSSSAAHVVRAIEIIRIALIVRSFGALAVMLLVDLTCLLMTECTWMYAL